MDFGPGEVPFRAGYDRSNAVFNLPRGGLGAAEGGKRPHTVPGEIWRAIGSVRRASL